MKKATMDGVRRGFGQVSDIVAPETIRACTGTCDKPDCHLSCQTLSTKLGGISISYDKDGALHLRDDNERTTYVCCSTCWGEWLVSQSGNRITSVVKKENA